MADAEALHRALAAARTLPDQVQRHAAEDKLLGEYADAAECYAAEPKRWYILAVFSMFSFNQCLVWFTFSSVDYDKVAGYYGEDNMSTTVQSLLLNWGPIIGIVFFPIQVWLTQRGVAGFRHAVLLGCLLQFAGTLIRTVPTFAGTPQSPGAITLLHLGQILNAAAGPLCMGTESRLSQLWFREDERATATSIAVRGALRAPPPGAVASAPVACRGCPVPVRVCSRRQPHQSDRRPPLPLPPPPPPCCSPRHRPPGDVERDGHDDRLPARASAGHLRCRLPAPVVLRAGAVRRAAALLPGALPCRAQPPAQRGGRRGRHEDPERRSTGLPGGRAAHLLQQALRGTGAQRGAAGRRLHGVAKPAAGERQRGGVPGGLRGVAEPAAAPGGTRRAPALPLCRRQTYRSICSCSLAHSGAEPRPRLPALALSLPLPRCTRSPERLGALRHDGLRRRLPRLLQRPRRQRGLRARGYARMLAALLLCCPPALLPSCPPALLPSCLLLRNAACCSCAELMPFLCRSCAVLMPFLCRSCAVLVVQATSATH